MVSCTLNLNLNNNKVGWPFGKSSSALFFPFSYEISFLISRGKKDLMQKYGFENSLCIESGKKD